MGNVTKILRVAVERYAGTGCLIQYYAGDWNLKTNWAGWREHGRHSRTGEVKSRDSKASLLPRRRCPIDAGATAPAAAARRVRQAFMDQSRMELDQFVQRPGTKVCQIRAGINPMLARPNAQAQSRGVNYYRRDTALEMHAQMVMRVPRPIALRVRRN